MDRPIREGYGNMYSITSEVLFLAQIPLWKITERGVNSMKYSTNVTLNSVNWVQNYGNFSINPIVQDWLNNIEFTKQKIFQSDMPESHKEMFIKRFELLKNLDIFPKHNMQESMSCLDHESINRFNGIHKLYQEQFSLFWEDENEYEKYDDAIVFLEDYPYRVKQVIQNLIDTQEVKIKDLPRDILPNVLPDLQILNPLTIQTSNKLGNPQLIYLYKRRNKNWLINYIMILSEQLN